MNKTKLKSNAIINRRAKFDYTLGDELVVGIVLKGPEVRSARDGHVQLKDPMSTSKITSFGSITPVLASN